MTDTRLSGNEFLVAKDENLDDWSLLRIYRQFGAEDFLLYASGVYLSPKRLKALGEKLIHLSSLPPQMEENPEPPVTIFI